MANPEKMLFRGKVVAVAEKDTAEGLREVVLHPGAVAIIVEDEAGRVLLVRQNRAGADGPLWEIPAGTLEPQERPLTTARQELWEETGIFARSLRFLAAFYPTPGYSSERIYLFRAGDIQGQPKPNSEILEVRFFTKGEITALAKKGLGDGKTLAALAFL